MLGRPNVVLPRYSDLLYVIDGVPVNSDTYNISADDVESYTVLKGPNAAALYGFRGQNGAIIITTRRGSRTRRDGRSTQFQQPGRKGFSWPCRHPSMNMAEAAPVVHLILLISMLRAMDMGHLGSATFQVRIFSMTISNASRMGPSFRGAAAEAI